MGRVIRLGAAAALLWALGCATVMDGDVDALSDPWQQLYLAQLLDEGMGEVRPDLAGRGVRVEVAPEDAFYSRYARARLEEGVWRAGGRVEPTARAALRLEVRSAGNERTERYLSLPVAQYANLPLYYGQHDAGELRAQLRLEEPEGTKTWDLSGVRKGRTSYAFRVVGPFGNRP